MWQRGSAAGCAGSPASLPVVGGTVSVRGGAAGAARPRLLRVSFQPACPPRCVEHLVVAWMFLLAALVLRVAVDCPTALLVIYLPPELPLPLLGRCLSANSLRKLL